VVRARFDPGASLPADLLVVGSLVTMDPFNPTAEALAVRDGRIVGVGSRKDLDGLRGAATEVLELGDHVAYPGFVDPHLHLWPSALLDGWLDCSPFAHDSFDDVLDVLRAANATPDRNGWVLGQSYDPSLFAGQPQLTRDLLDRVVPDRPALVMNASLHFAYLNSRALALAGIHDDTPDPSGGSFGRVDGHLDGSAAEMGAVGLVLAAVPRKSQEEMADGVVHTVATAARRGVTRLHDALTGTLFGTAELDMLHALAAEGRFPARIGVAIADQARAAVEAAGLVPGAGDDLVRAQSWKLVADGSNQGYSGYQSDPYLGTDGRGRPNYTDDELSAAMARAHGDGWQLMVHANGDAAVEQVVSAYERALAGEDPTVHDRRHRIEHCSLPNDDELARMAALGVSPSFLVNHVYFWGRAFRDDILGADRAGRLDPVASARRHGLRPTFHSDYTVTPVDPLRSVQTAVTRRMRDGGEVLNPAECDTVESALRGVTVDAAWQTHCDDVLGSLEVGKYADMVVLSGDPRIVDMEAIADLDVVETRLGGRVAFTG
jgi:predicted amidohydrolase YtcJ